MGDNQATKVDAKNGLSFGGFNIVLQTFPVDKKIQHSYSFLCLEMMAFKQEKS